MAEAQKSGSINLPGIFSAAADELLAAVTRGRILHASRNIRDSGAPLEAAVRAFFARLLPSPFLVQHGYLFDTASICTPQIDLIIAASERSQIMLRAPEGATYSPFTDAYAIAEIKASSNSIATHLDQFTHQLRAIATMGENLMVFGGKRLPDLISFVLLGDCEVVDEAAIQAHWKNHPYMFPDYIVLLSRGEIVMPRRSLPEFFGFNSDITPFEKPSGDHLAVYARGDEPSDKRGNALLWLFYAVLHRLRESQAHYLEFALTKIARRDENDLPSGARQTAEMISSAADPFAAAMMRDFKLNLIRQIPG